MLLNFIFLVHAAFAAVPALMLAFFPEWFTEQMTGLAWKSGNMADVAVIYARFAAVGLTLIVLGTSLARRSPSTPTRWAALASMLIISLVALLVAVLMTPLQPLKDLAFVANLLFAAAYLWVVYFRREEI